MAFKEIAGLSWLNWYVDILTNYEYGDVLIWVI
jgi:hypothetical protein